MATMTFDPEIAVEDVTVVRGGHKALTDVTFDVRPGTLMGVLGPNGAGKSTLFDVIAGVLPATEGTSDTARRGNSAGCAGIRPSTRRHQLGLSGHRSGRGDHGLLQRWTVREPRQERERDGPGLSGACRIVGAALVPDN